jgi:hypothetical protein
MDYTIANDFELPSLGKVYSKEVNPQVKLRSMTTMEEMKRLNHSERPYKAMSEIIDDCLVEDIGISAYDMCLPDYQFMMHKLRIVTYGPEYKITSTCPYCGSANNHTLNLDDMSVTSFDEEVFDKYSEFELPASKIKIKIRLQTPRMMDNITFKTKEDRRKNPKSNSDAALLFTLESLIEEIDGTKPESFRLIPFIQKLPMMDTNYILKAAQKLNTIFGLDLGLLNVCGVCGLDYTSSFRTTSEFFGPSID